MFREKFFSTFCANINGARGAKCWSKCRMHRADRSRALACTACGLWGVGGSRRVGVCKRAPGRVWVPRSIRGLGAGTLHVELRY